MRYADTHIPLLLLAVILFCPRALAIVLHPAGEPNIVSWTDHPDPNIIGRWGNSASCVAISTSCILTTRHQLGGIGTPVKLGKVTYFVTALWDHPTADLRIAKLYGANFQNFAELYTAADELNRQIVIAGFGFGRDTPLKTYGMTYGYNWDRRIPDIVRMGTNRIDQAIDDLPGSPYVTDVLVADFDALFDPTTTTYEAIPAGHDSGGGWFIKNDGRWKLVGLSRVVESHFELGHNDDPNHLLFQSWFRQRAKPFQPDPDYFDAVRVSSYADWIRQTLPSRVPGDLTGDDRVDFADLAVFARYWLTTDCASPNPCLGADFEPDGDVDWDDLIQLARNWLCSHPDS